MQVLLIAHNQCRVCMFYIGDSSETEHHGNVCSNCRKYLPELLGIQFQMKVTEENVSDE